MISKHRLHGFCPVWTIILVLGGVVSTMAQVSAAGSVSVKDFGAKGDGITDDRAAIQSAIDSLKAGVVYLPPAVGYLITPTPDKKTFLTLKSGLRLIGIGNPILKVAGSSAPYDHVILANPCDDCVIRDITIDSNISANPVQNESELHTHPRIEIAILTGRRITVDRVSVKNSSSVNSIASGLVSDFTITHCSFTGNGDDPNHTVHDHSALYIGADGAVIDNNIFTAIRRGAPAAVTAIETHGSGISITGNVITDYAIGMNITGVAPSDSVGTVVSNNTMRGGLIGIQIWSDIYKGHSSGYGVDGISITGNTIVINQTSYTGESSLAIPTSGIIIEPHSNLPIANLIILGNVIIFDLERSLRSANTASIGIGWWSTLAQSLENTLIADNIIDNAPVAGIRLAAALKTCRVSGNIIRNAGSSLDTVIAQGYKTPIFIAGAPSTDVEIVENQIVDSLQPSRMRTALLLATTNSTSTGLRVRNNAVSFLVPNNALTASYVEILDDRTRPLLIAAWDDFVAPTNRVAPGSAVADSKNGLSWQAGSDGTMSKRR
jgi:hypothetical protein